MCFVQRKPLIVFGLWLCTQMLSSMVQSGAFEVYYEGNVVFSKLESGRMPTWNDIHSKLELLMEENELSSFANYVSSH